MKAHSSESANTATQTTVTSNFPSHEKGTETKKISFWDRIQGSKLTLSDCPRRPTTWEVRVQFQWACPIGRVPLLHSHVHAEGLTKSVSKYDDDEHCSWLIEDSFLL